jgi:hypothetical protein
MFSSKKKKTKVFGVPLAESVGVGDVVASVVTDVVLYLEKHGTRRFVLCVVVVVGCVGIPST